MTSAPGIRARNRAAIESEILRIGIEHLGRYGAAAISLRAIARELDMSSSAVYRYVESRDELLTRLIVAALDSLGDQVDEALAADASTDPRRQFRVIATTLREWALAHPHEYALIYGSPVPEYDAPADRTTPAGTRVQARLMEVLATWAPPHTAPSASEAEIADRAFGALLEPLLAATGLDRVTLHRGIVAWLLVMGAISGEIFGQLGAETVADPAALFEGVVAAAESIVGRPG